MRALVTGANGTVGKVLCSELEKAGHEVRTWDRHRVPIDEYQPMEDFVISVKPDVVFHLAIASKPSGMDNEGWIVNENWPSELAWIARTHEIKMVYVSTVMVFTNDAKGPFTKFSDPDEKEGYGGEKRRAEVRVQSQYPQATIARLGWQIGREAGSNNMVDFMEARMREDGVIKASTKWFPATSMLKDTARGLIDAANQPGKLVHLDGNHRERGWNFFEIATALKEYLDADWKVEATDDFVYDQRMIDSPINGTLANTLPLK
jgi:dTDP-4-dehydrorhamnose reductase